ncbi:MAG TPA: ComF family protein [Pyrinomonadaceae bacterium]|jgi:ComF family protein|nr:ComF family protein [Chloracidobacterium sp.]HQY68470.1 ComF family protein [Pyrinomonadaceae bacterium]HRA40697.1 ComF family protein [Pyrinomonadaceae bacterium]
MFKVFRDSLLSLIYPSQCCACDRLVENFDDGVACAICWQMTRLFDGSQMLCAKCGAYFNESSPNVNVFCRKCDEHHYDRAVAGGIYERAISASINRLKSHPVVARRVADVLTSVWDRSGFQNADLIIPVPLSDKRRIERGFNQSEILGTVISRRTGVEVDAHSLIRKIHTPIHRKAMDEKARELSVRDAFEVVRPKLIAGKHIVLIDDVFTSGSTVSNCSKVLKKSGAASVNVITLARAVKQ